MENYQAESFGVSWLADEWAQPVDHTKSWRYFITYKGEDVSPEYKNKDEAVEIAALYGKGYKVRSYEPTLEELATDETERKSLKRFSETAPHRTLTYKSTRDRYAYVDKVIIRRKKK